MISGKQAEYSSLNVPKLHCYIMLWVLYGQTLDLVCLCYCIFFSLIPQNLAWWLAHRTHSINVLLFFFFICSIWSNGGFRLKFQVWTSLSKIVKWGKCASRNSLPFHCVPHRCQCTFAVLWLRLWISTVTLSPGLFLLIKLFLDQ